MKIKRPGTQQTEIVISIDMKTASSGHLSHETASSSQACTPYCMLDLVPFCGEQSK
ncbi:hypothetical protein YC2023_024358 [Brassica napus]